MNELYIINEEKTIVQAMQQLDRSAKKILFVHEHGRLLATVTDGDIRRWILKNGDLQAAVKCAANYQPIFLYESQSATAMQVMKEVSIDAIPIVDKNQIIKKIVFYNAPNEINKKFEINVPIVMMAGGRGTRLLPYTNILPKPLIPIGEIPISEHIIHQFQKYGCQEFYMIVNYKRNMIKAYFDDIEKEYTLEFITEEKMLGTGGGVSLLKGKIKKTFILTNCDILIEDDLSRAYEQHKESKSIITMVCSLKNFIIPYGVVNINNQGAIESLQEKPEMNFLTNTGCYIVEPQVIEELDYNEPIDFPNIIEKYRKQGKRIGVYPISENCWLDMGQLDELEKMKQRLRY